MRVGRKKQNDTSAGLLMTLLSHINVTVTVTVPATATVTATAITATFLQVTTVTASITQPYHCHRHSPGRVGPTHPWHVVVNQHQVDLTAHHTPPTPAHPAPPCRG